MKSELVAAMGVCVLTGCIFTKERPSLQFNVEAATQYNHRGMVQNDRGVAQPELTADLPVSLGGNLNVRAWGNLNLTAEAGDAWFPDGHPGKFSEIDLSTAYSRQLGPVNLAAGVVGYILPDGADFPNGVRGSTTEVFTSAGTALFEGKFYSLRPVARVHYDGDEANGLYLNGGLFKSFAVIRNLSADLGVSLGYSDDGHSDWTYGLSEEGIADLRGTARFLYALSDNTTAWVGLGASTIIDRDLQDWFDLLGIDRDNVWGTVGLGWSF
jgi:hypothetical protein